MSESDVTRDDEEKAHLLAEDPPATVAYFATDYTAIYRIVAGFSGWRAQPGLRWEHFASHRPVLDEVGIFDGSTAWTPRITRAEALAQLAAWGIAPDELDELPEEPIP